MDKFCPACGTKTFEVAETCMNCNFQFYPDEKPDKLHIMVKVGFILAIISGLTWNSSYFITAFPIIGGPISFIGFLSALVGLFICFEHREKLFAKYALIINGIFLSASVFLLVFSLIRFLLGNI